MQRNMYLYEHWWHILYIVNNSFELIISIRYLLKCLWFKGLVVLRLKCFRFCLYWISWQNDYSLGDNNIHLLFPVHVSANDEGEWRRFVQPSFDKLNQHVLIGPHTFIWKMSDCDSVFSAHFLLETPKVTSRGMTFDSKVNLAIREC